MTDAPVRTVIEPSRGWVPLDVGELMRQRELLFFLAWRDLKVRYKQTLLGALWAILQPALMMVVFTFIGALAGVQTEGAPRLVFAYSGVLIWIYFQNSVLKSGNSLVGNERLITKIYFPRIFLPMAPALASLLDYAVGLGLLAAMLLWFGIAPDAEILLLGVLVWFAWIAAAGVGMFLSALNVRYRDVRFLMPFLLQLWMFVTPVIYPPSFLSGRGRGAAAAVDGAGGLQGGWQWLLALNPMGGIVDAHRAAILPTKTIDWPSLAVSVAVSSALFVASAFYFKRVERSFADVI